MANCVDCGEPMAIWEDYCPRCGARKAMTSAKIKGGHPKKKHLGFLVRSKKTG